MIENDVPGISGVMSPGIVLIKIMIFVTERRIMQASGKGTVTFRTLSSNDFIKLSRWGIA